MNSHIMHSVEELENVIFVCFGAPKGDELPQVASTDDVVMDTVRECTGKTLRLVDAEFHHQTDPSYQ